MGPNEATCTARFLLDVENKVKQHPGDEDVERKGRQADREAEVEVSENVVTAREGSVMNMSQFCRHFGQGWQSASMEAK